MHEVRRLLRHYVMNDLCRECLPDPNDRAYFPIDNDLKNHIYMAKRALQLSCLDQHNLRQKIEQWKVTDPESTHFFRPYQVKNGGEESDYGQHQLSNLQVKLGKVTSMAMMVEMRTKQ